MRCGCVCRSYGVGYMQLSYMLTADTGIDLADAAAKFVNRPGSPTGTSGYYVTLLSSMVSAANCNYRASAFAVDYVVEK